MRRRLCYRQRGVPAFALRWGDHLAQAYEAAGKKDEALATYTLAEAANLPAPPQSVRDHIRESIARLKGTTTKTSERGGATMALQQLRTYKIAKPQDAAGWGTFRLEITATGVIESQKSPVSNTSRPSSH